jgi:GDP-L-fucose synthase
MRIYIAGHQGMVGSSLVRELRKDPSVDLILKTRSQLNLLDQKKVSNFFKDEEIDQVYLAAAKVGGIVANEKFSADFIYENLTIQNNVINSSHEGGVQKLLYLGSSCIYPKFAEQPIKEDSLLRGDLEKTNESYAIAKIAGIKTCEAFNKQHHRDYRSVMPTNLYGPNDNFHSENSHVIPGLIRRFHDSKISQQEEVQIWGTGTPKREFLHVDDMAHGCIKIMNLELDRLNDSNDMSSHINLGTGKDIEIKSLANLISKIVGFEGNIVFDRSKPDGTPRKVLNIDKVKDLGWQSAIGLEEGITSTYNWFLDNQELYRG